MFYLIVVEPDMLPQPKVDRASATLSSVKIKVKKFDSQSKAYVCILYFFCLLLKYGSRARCVNLEKIF